MLHKTHHQHLDFYIVLFPLALRMQRESIPRPTEALVAHIKTLYISALICHLFVQTHKNRKPTLKNNAVHCSLVHTLS